jgi:hypothetical protein
MISSWTILATANKELGAAKQDSIVKKKGTAVNSLK